MHAARKSCLFQVLSGSIHFFMKSAWQWKLQLEADEGPLGTSITESCFNFVKANEPLLHADQFM